MTGIARNELVGLNHAIGVALEHAPGLAKFAPMSWHRLARHLLASCHPELDVAVYYLDILDQMEGQDDTPKD